MIDAPGLNLDLEQIDDSSVRYPGVIPPDVCQQIIERHRGDERTITRPNGCLLRTASVDQVDQLAGTHEILHAIFRATALTLDWDIHHAEVARFAVSCYRAGDCMEEHVDDEERGPQTDWSVPHRGVSISVPLSEPSTYSGGRLRLRTRTGEWYYPDLDQGDAIALGSSTPHEVTKVTRGERWVLLAWCYVNHDFWDCR